MTTQVDEFSPILDDPDAGLWEVVKTFYGIAVLAIVVLAFIGAMALRGGEARRPPAAAAAGPGAPLSTTAALYRRNVTIYLVDSSEQAADVTFSDQAASSVLDSLGYPMPERSFHVLQAGTPEEMTQAQTEVLRIARANNGARSVIELLDLRRR